MKEEYEIIFIPEEGRAILNKKTNKIYYSEFVIIEEKDKEIERLNNIINELEGWLKSNEEHFAEAIPFRETLRKLKELKENK